MDETFCGVGAFVTAVGGLLAAVELFSTVVDSLAGCSMGLGADGFGVGAETASMDGVVSTWVSLMATGFSVDASIVGATVVVLLLLSAIGGGATGATFVVSGFLSEVEVSAVAG